MEIIQQIGSYAGLAAVVGLAVLAGLYFSQARDVKRLREWAGRAPERVPAPYQQPHRAVAQPMRQPLPPRPPVPPGATPGAQPAPAQAAAAGAAPAVATGPLAATPAAARAAESAAGTDAVRQNTVAPPPHTLPPRQAPPGLGGHFAREAQIARAREEAERVEGAHAEGESEGEELGPEDEELRPEDEELGPEDEELSPEDEELGHEDEELGHVDGELEDEAEYDPESDPDPAALPEPEDFHEGHELVDEPEPPDAGDQPAVMPPVRPPPPPITATRQPLPARPAPPPRSSQPAQGPILPPYEQSPPGVGAGENRTFSPSKAALAIGGAAVVVAAAAFGVLQLTGEDDGASKPAKRSTPAGVNQPAEERKRPGKPAIDPRTVTVSVLNGTTVGGLAAQLGDRLEGQGFQLGNVTNNTDQQRAESVVLFAPGAEDEGKDVGRRLKIDQREPIDPDSQTRAGDATVVVVAGADLDR